MDPNAIEKAKISKNLVLQEEPTLLEISLIELNSQNKKSPAR